MPEGADWVKIEEDPELMRLLGGKSTSSVDSSVDAQVAQATAALAAMGGLSEEGRSRHRSVDLSDPTDASAPLKPSKEALVPGTTLCRACQQPLWLHVCEALGGFWHPDCFVCGICSQPFDDGAFVVHEGLPLHKACHIAKNAPKCAVCTRPLDGSSVVVDGKKMHSTCFVCTVCKCTLEGGYALGADGSPYCAKHVSSAPRADAAGGAPAAPPPKKGDPFTIDVKTGEKIFIEPETKRKYRRGPDGAKAYEDERPKPKYGGATSWRTDTGKR
jgi:hypothetical protein